MIRPVLCSVLALTVLVAAGCESKKETSPEGTSDSSTGEKSGISAILVKADVVDGKADKVVQKCAGCALGMDGHEDHTIKAHGYTLRFCNGNCKKAFEKDTDKSILSMKIPDD